MSAPETPGSGGTGAGTGARSAIIVPVPEVEHLVAPWRDEHDPVARRGVPAHITLLSPFLPSTELHTALPELRALFGTHPRSSFRFTHVGRFPSVSWLAPEPASLFRDLTLRLVEHFPGCPPYEGAFDSVIPHVTVIDHSTNDGGQDHATHEAFLQRANAALPIDAELSEVRVLSQDDRGQWSTHTTFVL